MSNFYRRARESISQALALSDSLIRYAQQPDTPPHAARAILDRAPLLSLHLIDAHRAVVKLERENPK